MKSVEINGTCYSKFEKIKDILQKEINTGLSLGSAFAVYHNGEPLIDVYGGYTDKKKIKKWNKKTIVPVHSVGKGIVSLCLMLLMNRKQLDIDAYVADYWSGFSNNSKSQIKIRTLFSHQAGLYGWRKEMKHNDLYDWDYCVNSLAKQKPFHRPEEETCYHAKTIGYLSGEIIRRITKKSVGKFISDELSNKKDLYCYIGVPCEFHSRISEVISMKENSKYNLNRKISDKYSNYGFNNPQSLKNSDDLKEWRTAEIPSLNCHANASTLARIYDQFVNDDESLIIDKKIFNKALSVESNRMDYVMRLPIKWSPIGLIIDGGKLFGNSKKAFGHTGSGGSIAFADPERKLSISYTSNTLSKSLIGDKRAIKLVSKFYELF